MSILAVIAKLKRYAAHDTGTVRFALVTDEVTWESDAQDGDSEAYDAMVELSDHDIEPEQAALDAVTDRIRRTVPVSADAVTSMTATPGKSVCYINVPADKLEAVGKDLVFWLGINSSADDADMFRVAGIPYITLTSLTFVDEHDNAHDAADVDSMP